MELRFVIASLRRRWWVVFLGAVVGAIAGSVVAGPQGRAFESTTVLADLSTGTGPVSPDRLVAEQIALIQSTAVLEPVAKRFSISTDDLRSKISVEQQPATDLVNVVATDRDPERARALSQSVADEYIASERSRIEARQQETVRAVDDRITAVQGELSALTDPTNRALKEKEYGELLATKARILFDSSTAAASQVVEPANAPSPVPRTRRWLLPAAGIIFGGAVGFALAATWARVSRFVVEDESAAEMLASTYAGRLRLPAASTYPEGGRLLWRPSDLTAVDVVAAHAQASNEPGSPLRVLVIAAQRGAGATAVTLALAQALSRSSERVVLVDADDRNPELSDVLARQRPQSAATNGQAAGPEPGEVDDEGGREGRTNGEQREDGGARSSEIPDPDGEERAEADSDDFWSAEIPEGLGSQGAPSPTIARAPSRKPLDGEDHEEAADRVGEGPELARSDALPSAGMEGDSGGSIVLVDREAGGLRRELVPALLDKAAATGDVVVVDAGPLLESAPARELCRLADAVVFVISSRKQRTDVLKYAALQLDAVTDKVLVVSVSLRPRRHRSR